mmetsp:Transcript_85767/g.232657  ORF Transcript_85767/g.232657 Transcript_85767/m.232657 type:complete len:86 (+) Transcript_85767:548-805(+)
MIPVRVPRNSSAHLFRCGCDFLECISSTPTSDWQNSSEYSCVDLAVVKKTMILYVSGQRIISAFTAAHSSAVTPSMVVMHTLWSI